MYEYYTKCLYKNVLISNIFHEFEKYSVMNLAHIFTLKVVIPILGPQKFQTNQYSILNRDRIFSLENNLLFR